MTLKVQPQYASVPSGCMRISITSSHLLASMKFNLHMNFFVLMVAHIAEQQRLRRACASAKTCQSLCCLHTKSIDVDDKDLDQNLYLRSMLLRIM